jgi:endonuclease/exonuclease/phosphatase family metal-dependent hydrolase
MLMMVKKIIIFRSSLILLICLICCLNVGVVFASNRVLNNGFEYLGGVSNDSARHWTRSNATYCYATSGTGVGRSGNAAIYITSTDVGQVNSWTSEKFAVTPGSTYTCQVWMKWDNVVAGTVRARFRGYDANGTGNYISDLSLSTTGNSASAWVLLSGTYTVPSNGRCMDVYLATENASNGATIYFDDVSIAEPNPNFKNLIINSNFEGLDGTYPAFWRRNTGTTNAGWTTGFYRSATTSVYIKQNSGDNFTREWYIAEGAPQAYIAINSTKTYRFGGWMQWDRVTVENIGLRVEWMNQSDDTISITAIATNGVNLGQWKNLDSGAVLPPAGAVAARVRLFNTDTVSISAIVWFDDVYFEETDQPQSSFMVRALTYNIKGSAADLAQIASVISAENPDIVGLNEVYRYTIGNKQDQVIAGYLGSQWTTVFSNNAGGFGYQYGNAILSRYPIVSSVNHLIKPQIGFEQRGCLEAHINVNGTMVTAFSTHWASDSAVECQLSADSCLVWLSQVSEPKILMGDFNSRTYSNPFRRVQTQYTDAVGVSAFGILYTYIPNPNITGRIDHIFLPENTTIKETHVVSYGAATIASDHFPVTTLFIGGGSLPVRLSKFEIMLDEYNDEYNKDNIAENKTGYIINSH